MKKLLFPILLFALPALLRAQDATDILIKSSRACKNVDQGYYKMTRYMKYMSGPDTTVSSYVCDFRRIKGDSIFGSAFYYRQFYKDTCLAEYLYTGNEFYYMHPRDSSAEVQAMEKWASYAKRMAHNRTFFKPFTSDQNTYPMLADTEIVKPVYTLFFEGSEQISGNDCWHVRVMITPEKPEPGDMIHLRMERHFWVNKKDMLPVQYSVAYDIVDQNDTMYQYERVVLNEYKVGKLRNKDVITPAAVPGHYRVKEFTDYIPPKLLAVDTIAPDWTLTSLDGKKITLSEMKGKVVLLDFFYKSCHPCMQALPTLQKLHSKYKDSGLIVVGIDPYDSEKDNMPEFLKKRGVDYTVVLHAQSVSKDYHVSAYPTLYLVDKRGNILHVNVGYGSETEAALEKIIVEGLKR